MFKLYSDLFNHDSPNSHSGGSTGSVAKKDSEGNLYQVKATITHHSFLRRIKAVYTDRENLGEMIAACISSSLLHSKSPQVHLLYDASKKEISIASKYLGSEEPTHHQVQDLDKFTFSGEISSPTYPDKCFVYQTAADPSRNEVTLNDNPILRKELSTAIALSILIGDHDINPGNMVVTSNSPIKIARIDFGHAFNDLLNCPEKFGGIVKNKQNHAIDYFNRHNVAGYHPSIYTSRFVVGGKSKLWRYFPGLIMSQEMVDALKESSNLDNRLHIANGIDLAKTSIIKLTSKIIEEKDHYNLRLLKRSLIAIHNNLVDDHQKITNSDQYISAIINKVFIAINLFVHKNLYDMQIAAEILQYQVTIDSILNKDILDTQDLDIIKSEFDNLKEKINLSPDTTSITWIKTTFEQPTITGTLQDYINSRREQLNKAPVDLSQTCKFTISAIS